MHSLKDHVLSEKQMIIKLGDIVQVLGINDEEQEEYWYGEIVGRVNRNEFEIYYIKKNQGSENQGVYEFEETYHTVEKDCINRVIRTKHGDYANAWKQFGFAYHPGPPIYLSQDPEYRSEPSADDDSESLDSCDSWSSSDEESVVSNLIDDSEKITYT